MCCVLLHIISSFLHFLSSCLLFLTRGLITMSNLFHKRKDEPSMLNMEDNYLRHVEKDVIIPKMFA